MSKNLVFKPTLGICIGAAISVGAIYAIGNLSGPPEDLRGKILTTNGQPSTETESIEFHDPSMEPSRISLLPENDEIELWSKEPERSQPDVESSFGRSEGYINAERDDSIRNSLSKTVSDNEFDSILSNPIEFNHSAASESVGPLKSNIKPRESTSLQAVQHIEYGKALARRGALSSAKLEFINALSVLTQDFDFQTGNSGYSRSLQAGLLALKEAEDFTTQESEGQILFDSSSLVESHHSGVLKPYDAKGMTLSQIREAYFSFAESQILQGVGKSVISAEALHSLGRLYSLRAENDHSKIGLVQAAIFHRGAIQCNPKDHRSANDLGVLLSEFGELNSSVELLKQSLRIQPNPQTWDNLAKLHRRLNQHDLAEKASAEHQRALATLNTGMIQWMEPPTFNAAAPPDSTMVASLPDGMQGKPANGSNKTNPSPTQSSEENKANSQKSVGDRIKSWF